MITDSNIRSSSNKLRISDSLCFCDSKLCYLKWNSAPQLFMCDGMCTRNKGNMLIGLNIEIRFHKYNIHGKKLSTFIWMVTIITFFYKKWNQERHIKQHKDSIYNVTSYEYKHMLTHLEIREVRARTAQTEIWWAKVSMGILKSKTQKCIFFKRYTIYITVLDQNNYGVEATKRKAWEVSKICILLRFAIPLYSKAADT